MGFRSLFHQYLQGIVNAWTDYANYILSQAGFPVEDIQICKDALKLLSSDIPDRFTKEVFEAPKVSRKTLDEAEAFDVALWRMKLLPLPLTKVQKKELRELGKGCVSFEKTLLMAILTTQGRLD